MSDYKTIILRVREDCEPEDNLLFEEMVKNNFAGGWELQGGLSVSMEAKASNAGYLYTMAQAMVRNQTT